MLPRILCAVLALPAALAAAPPNVDWKSLKTSRGDGLPDFSFAGYHASNGPLPSTNRAATTSLSPASGDQTKRIQDALNKVFSGGGGVVALAAGDYELSAGLTIPKNTSLRGAGPGKTILLPTDGSKTTVTMGTKVSDPKPGTAVAITDKYVPVGAIEITVKSASGFKVGQSVYVQRAVTDKWVRANGMDDLVRDGKPQTWLKPGDLVQQPRTITAISGSAITLSIPLTDTLNADYMSPQLVPFTPPTADSEMGLESLSITLSPSCSGRIITDHSCKGSALMILPWSTNSYARSISLTGFNNAVNINPNASQITLQSVSIHRDHATDNGAGYAADIGISGYQVLVVHSGTKGDSDAKSFPIVTQGLTPGPNAVVGHFAQQADMQIQPHAHWAHGLLVDNSTATTTLINRGTAGSGHGWAINSGVAWNVVGDWEVQSPPLGTNWGVGMRGSKDKETNGSVVAEGKEVSPVSLFEQQLSERGAA